MNAAELQGYVTAHKPAVLGAAAAGVLGLALLKRKKAATGATGGGLTGSVGGQPAGTIPAAAVSPAGQSFGSTYDSSAYDVYNALSGQLEQLRQTTGGGGATPVAAPAPIASTLFAPSGSGNYVHYSNGTIGEVESDGSLFGFSPQQWDSTWLASGKPNPTEVSGPAPKIFTTAGNLAAKNPSS